MGKAIAATSILIGLALEGWFLLAGAAAAWLAVAGAVALVAGVLLLGRPAVEEGVPPAPYPVREAVLVLCVAAGFGFALALVIGVARSWSEGTLAALAVGGGAETLIGLGLGIQLSTDPGRDRLLFVPGLAGAVILALFHLLLLVLGAS